MAMAPYRRSHGHHPLDASRSNTATSVLSGSPTSSNATLARTHQDARVARVAHPQEAVPRLGGSLRRQRLGGCRRGDTEIHQGVVPIARRLGGS